MKWSVGTLALCCALGVMAGLALAEHSIGGACLKDGHAALQILEKSIQCEVLPSK